MIWTTENLQRIVLDTAGRVSQQPHAGLPGNVPANLDLYQDLGLNSLQRMELAAYLNEFFGILHTSATNYLLAGTSLNHWTNCILRARQESDDSLTFRTSGTGGAAKATTHAMTSLLAEARFLANLLGRPSQVVSTVPANHIYGFLYTVALPAIWQCPVQLLADVTAADLTPDTLVVGTPFTWQFLHQSLLTGAQVRCRGVTSTAPMPPALFAELVASGISLTEIYGSSETGGLGWRQQAEAPFTLFPYLDVLATDPPTVRRTDTGDTYLMPDRLAWPSPRELHVLGRTDEAIQIAGVNVYLAHIRQVIETCPLVADCDVHAKAEASVPQLFAAVRLRTHTDANREATLRWIRSHLTAPETPKHLYLY